ncbi:MAG: peptidyl-alpha-hydroxyglycine alpha-amidating lyase family protein [Gemmatimonadetes bacterium]|nr:peptidyl-alpha-hydroxyglycine alpha-amidating lyase family protein [Gemmatimonadota bacterium]
MACLTRVCSALAAALTLIPFLAQAATAQMTAPNPYRTVEGVWAELPNGRTWGSTSAVYTAPDGMSIWVADRCGANTCVGSDVDPVLRYDLDGNLMTSFGVGMVVWPHGMFVDAEGNVWVADAVGFGDTPTGRGHVVLKFSPEGELLMKLGEDGVAGTDQSHFDRPNDVLVAPDGSIFVADGHNPTGNNRIMKFAADGTFLLEWGTTGGDNGEFREPHALAMDSQGRLFVADRYNNRLQLFDQEGTHLANWSQFSRLSGIFIDKNDVLYAADSESNARRNPGWKRGIYIGSAVTGFVEAFIPDPEPDPDNSGTSAAEGVAVDAMGNVYGAEVGPRMLRKYIRR